MNISKLSRGMSLITVLVAVAVLSIVSVMFSKLLKTGVGGAAHVGNSMDLESIKMSLLQQFDCRASLGVLPSTTLPISCASFSSVPIKRSNGTDIFSGPAAGWTMAATCTGNEVIFSATRTGNDPLTNQPYATSSNATDVFRGASEFCRQYFDPSPTCPTAPNNIRIGESPEGRPRCCRLVIDDTIGSGYAGAPTAADHPSNPGFDTAGVGWYAIAQCGAAEYLHSGGGECPDYMLASNPRIGFLHTSGPYTYNRISQVGPPVRVEEVAPPPANLGMEPQAWIADCHGFDFTVPNQPTSTHRRAKAWAICCPTN